ncbi:MAG: putative DNA-binding domain-containing protein [Telluria sp.]|nr:putative DNA-binding domain-containing protein [Telluria sp.]
MNLSLAEQQDALLQALRQQRYEDAIAFAASRSGLIADVDGGQWRRGLTAYRSNGHELAQRALAGAYPAIAQLLGEDNFAGLARSLWAAHPPGRGDIAQWGAELAAHIESLPELIAEEPFMADVARVEWLLHRAATAADVQLDMSSLQLLTQQDPASFTLALCPGAGCLVSAFPVASIVNAHIAGEPSLEEAGHRLRCGRAETALVWRQGFKPRLREALPGEAALVAALQERRSLADSLQAAPGLDFGPWLANAAQSGLLAGVAAL